MEAISEGRKHALFASRARLQTHTEKSGPFSARPCSKTWNSGGGVSPPSCGGWKGATAPSALGLHEILGLVVRPWACSLTAPPPLGRKSPTCHACGKPLRLCKSSKCGRVKRAKCKLCPNFWGVWPLMNIVSRTVPPAVHPAFTPPSLPPGK